MPTKLKIKDTKNGEKGSLELPSHFEETLRPDIVARAVLAMQSHGRQPYGADPEAGMKHSAELSRRRRKYRGSYGFGISRVPRKILSRRGTRFMWVGAEAPGMIGGRRAHAPKAEKNWYQKINPKERQKAIRSAMAATVNKDLVEIRGHKLPESFPFILSDEFQEILKTKEVVAALHNLGFTDELERSRQKSVRAGKGKSRGRKYNKKKGILIVVSGNCPLEISAPNIPGVDVVRVNELNVGLLAPGADLGRITLYTESAIKQLKERSLFYPKIKMFKELITTSKAVSKKTQKSTGQSRDGTARKGNQGKKEKKETKSKKSDSAAKTAK
ncbi:MAG: 50S ribosomal protein L4 [Candidatus Woesearchaeota archaeon]